MGIQFCRVKAVGAFGIFFFLAPNDAAVGLDSSIRIKGSAEAVELDVFVQREFGLSYKNLLVPQYWKAQKVGDFLGNKFRNALTD